MKYLTLFFIVFSTHFQIAWASINDEVIDDAQSHHNVLVSKVLNQLKLPHERCYCDLAVIKQLPFGKKDTVVVIPEISSMEENGDVFDLNSHILVVDTKTGKIKSSYFESARTNGWTSDAMRLEEISIDTGRYMLTNTYRAFGIRVKYVGSSRVNPWVNQTLSLFLPKGKKLKPVLKNMDVYKYHGEWDGICSGYRIMHDSQLKMVPQLTNGYRDIVLTTRSQKDESGKKHGDCIELIAIKDINIERLRYTSDGYQLYEKNNGYVYRGSINKRLPVELDIQILPNRTYQKSRLVVGTLKYLNSRARKPLTVIGTADYDNKRLSHINLKEFAASGNITGLMLLSPFGKGLVGDWSKPRDTSSDMNLKLRLIKKYTPTQYIKTPAKKNWFGKYVYQYGEKGFQGGFTLKKAKHGEADFSFGSLTEAPARNMADIDSVVKLNQAGFVLKPFTDTPKCEIQAQFFDGFATLAYTDENATSPCPFGHRATAEGIFLKVK